jgi:hypothetical protein
MRTNRAYRQALPHRVAVEEVLANSGRQFDPRIVDALLRVVEHEAPAEGDPPPAAPSITPRRELDPLPPLPVLPEPAQRAGPGAA